MNLRVYPLPGARLFIPLCCKSRSADLHGRVDIVTAGQIPI